MENREGVVAGGENVAEANRLEHDHSGDRGDVLHAEGRHSPEQHSNPDAVTAWHFQPDERPRQVAIDQLAELIEEDANFVWVDLSSYTRDDLSRVAAQLQLHPRVARIAVSSWQRPRIEAFGDHVVVTTTVPHLEGDTYHVEARELDLVVGRNYLLSVHKLPLPFAERLTTRAKQDPDLVRLDSALMLYMILDELLEYFEDLETTLRTQVEHMQRRAFRDGRDDFLEDLLHFKRYTFALHQLADEHRAVFQAFLRPDFSYVSGDDLMEYFRGLDARYARQVDRLQAAQQEVTSAFDIYVSRQAQRTNSIVKVLTMVSATLLPVSVVISFFATSFRDLGFLYSAQGFGIMLAAVVLVVGSALFAFRHSGWL